MPVLDSGREMFSNLVKGVSTIEREMFLNYHYVRVMVEGTTTISPIGTPLVWDATAAAFVVYVAQDLALVTAASSLPNGSPVCITVGTREGYGFNRADVLLNNTTGVEMTVLYRGPAQIVNDAIKWGTATAGDQAEFIAALEDQDISVVDAAEIVDPSFIVA